VVVTWSRRLIGVKASIRGKRRKEKGGGGKYAATG